MKNNGRLILFTLILVVLATACKYFFGPDLDWSGFSPVIAIALFSGFIIKQKDMSFLLAVACFVYQRYGDTNFIQTGFVSLCRFL